MDIIVGVCKAGKRKTMTCLFLLHNKFTPRWLQIIGAVSLCRHRHIIAAEKEGNKEFNWKVVEMREIVSEKGWQMPISETV